MKRKREKRGKKFIINHILSKNRGDKIKKGGKNMKTSDGEINTLTIKDVTELVSAEKPLFFNINGDRVAFVFRKDKSKDMHAGTWCLGDKVVIVFTNIPQKFVPEFSLHEISELSIVKILFDISEEAVTFEPAVQNVVHYINAVSLNQYNTEEKAQSPIRYHLCSDAPASFEKGKNKGGEKNEW